MKKYLSAVVYIGLIVLNESPAFASDYLSDKQKIENKKKIELNEAYSNKRWSGWCEDTPVKIAKESKNSEIAQPNPGVNLPEWVCVSNQAEELNKQYELYTEINPYYITGDFNGDGKQDIAIQVRERKSKNISVVIIHKGTTKFYVIESNDEWSLYPKAPIEQSPYEQGVPKLVGDALWFAKSGSASGYSYWNGEKYVWYQESD